MERNDLDFQPPLRRRQSRTMEDLDLPSMSCFWESEAQEEQSEKDEKEEEEEIPQDLAFLRQTSFRKEEKDRSFSKAAASRPSGLTFKSTSPQFELGTVKSMRDEFDDDADHPAPERQRCTSDQKALLEAASMRIMEMAAMFSKQLEAKQRKLRQRKERKCRTWGSGRSTPLASALNDIASLGIDLDEKELETIVIFDWDDTLFPTWHLTEIVQPCMAEKYAKLPEDSIFYDDLAAHGKLIEDVLRAASSIGQVYILTLGKRPWVQDSTDWFLPGLDIESLLSELGSKVYYAREYVSKFDRYAAHLEDGVNLYTLAKTNAMKKCVKRALAKSEGKYSNLISVGDSLAERQACRDLIWDSDADDSRSKVVKLLPDPTLKILASELNILKSWLPPLNTYEKDCDIDMSNPSSLPECLSSLVAQLGAQPTVSPVGSRNLRRALSPSASNASVSPAPSDASSSSQEEAK